MRLLPYALRTGRPEGGVTERVDSSQLEIIRVDELPDARRAVRTGRALQSADVAAKVENALVALEHAAERTGQVADGKKQAYGKLHARLRQSISPFQDLHPSDVQTLSAEQRWSLGARLGAELSKLLTDFPRALEVLEADGKGGKASALHDALQKVLETLAVKLESIPIATPELARLLGDPPKIDGENAAAIVEKLKSDLDGHSDGPATPEQRIAALFLTDSVADELRAALASRGADPSSVTELLAKGKSRRQRISLALRKGAVVAATLALTVPALVHGVTRDAPVDSVRDPVTATSIVTPAETPAPLPTIDPSAVHDPITIRTAQAPNERERARQEAREAIVRADEEEVSSNPAGIPAVARATVVEHLDAAGFPVKQFDEPGPNTGEIQPIEEAVATFQESTGLEPTGVVTVETWDRLEESIIVADPSNVAFSPPQELGERSEAVKQSEEILAGLNRLPKERVDGVFDEATQQASRAFEDAHPGLGSDGAIDLEQFRAMVRELVQRETSKPDVVSRPSPNWSPRGTDINGIVLHHTASNSVEGDLATLRSRAAEVSANFLIGRDGTIYELVPEDKAAWHAGEALLNGRSDVNSSTIGIEITNDGSGHTPFTPEQYRALERLVPYLVAKYDIPIENIVGHKEVAIPAGRKPDPAPNFDEARIVEAVQRVQELEKLA